MPYLLYQNYIANINKTPGPPLRHYPPVIRALADAKRRSSCSCGVKQTQIDEVKIVTHRRGASLGIATWWQSGTRFEGGPFFRSSHLLQVLDWKAATWSEDRKAPMPPVVEKIHAIVKRHMEVWSQRGPQHLNYWALADAGLLTSGPHPQSQLPRKRKSVASE